MPNTSPNSPTPSQNPSTCPEDSASTTTAWPDDGASSSWGAARDPAGGRRSSLSSPPSPSMPELVPAVDEAVLTVVGGGGRDSPATERSATLSPGEVGSRGTPVPEENEEGGGGDADSVRWRSPERVEGEGLDFREEGDCSAVSMGPDYSSLRAITTSPSSYLRPGTRFQGAQSSERQKYIVSVEIKHVDLRDSFLCGYLRIQDLTEDHPTLTTYFEGEILGQKHTFITPHASWGATPKDDLSHWSKFAAFRPYARAARKGPVFIRDLAQQEHIFMRWKEQFLVPDHRVTTIRGASFEGFYYICFNQVKGEVSGIYFHSKSERFQQLELKHVEDRGCFPAVEFR